MPPPTSRPPWRPFEIAGARQLRVGWDSRTRRTTGRLSGRLRRCRCRWMIPNPSLCPATVGSCQLALRPWMQSSAPAASHDRRASPFEAITRAARPRSPCGSWRKPSPRARSWPGWTWHEAWILWRLSRAAFVSNGSWFSSRNRSTRGWRWPEPFSRVERWICSSPISRSSEGCGSVVPPRIGCIAWRHLPDERGLSCSSSSRCACPDR
jgi:hypothetical protein